MGTLAYRKLTDCVAELQACCRPIEHAEALVLLRAMAATLPNKNKRAVLVLVALPQLASNHAKNKIAGRHIPFLVLDFWDKNTGICT